MLYNRVVLHNDAAVTHGLWILNTLSTYLNNTITKLLKGLTLQRPLLFVCLFVLGLLFLLQLNHNGDG